MTVPYFVKYTSKQHLLRCFGQVVTVVHFVAGSTAATFLSIFWRIA